MNSKATADVFSKYLHNNSTNIKQINFVHKIFDNIVTYEIIEASDLV